MRHSSGHLASELADGIALARDLLDDDDDLVENEEAFNQVPINVDNNNAGGHSQRVFARSDAHDQKSRQNVANVVALNKKH